MLFTSPAKSPEFSLTTDRHSYLSMHRQASSLRAMHMRTVASRPYATESARIAHVFLISGSDDMLARLPLRASTHQRCESGVMASLRSLHPQHHRRPWDLTIRPRLRGILTSRDPDISPPSPANTRAAEPLGLINRFNLPLVSLE